LRFHTFQSIVIALGGRGQDPSDPPAPDPNDPNTVDPNEPNAPEPNDPNWNDPNDTCVSLRTAGVCAIAATLEAAAFTTGNLHRWPDGAPIAPPPGGYQWWSDSGSQYPVVIGFDEWVDTGILAEIHCVSGDCNSAVPLRALVGAVVFAEGWLPLQQDSLVAAEMYAVIAFPASAIGKHPWWVMYEYSLDGGQTWEVLGTAGPTAWYVMPRAWASPPPGPYYRRYDFGLDKVVQYASGLSDADAISTAITQGIEADIYYDPGKFVRGHPLDIYLSPRALCLNHAQLLEHLAEAAGLGGSVTTTWGGSGPDIADFYLPPWATFQLVRQAHEGAPANPRFSYHALGCVNGTLYDPSYGDAQQPLVAEVCHPYRREQTHQEVVVYPDGIVIENHVDCCCDPGGDHVPGQQWGTTWPPPTIWYVHCPGTEP